MGSCLIVGIDPGKSLGLVRCELSDDEPLSLLHSEELKAEDEVEQRSQFDLIETEVGYADLVICERFVSRTTSFAADAASACEPIGVAKYLCWRYDVPLELPVPNARLVVSDKALRRSGYWIASKQGDARQAMKHVLAYVTEVLRHRPTLERLRPRK